MQFSWPSKENRKSSALQRPYPQSRAVMLHVKDTSLMLMWTRNSRAKTAGGQETLSEYRKRRPWERALKLCIQQQQENPWVLKLMETPGWQPTRKASPMEGEGCWIGPLTLIAERKNPKWQLEQEVVVRVTVGFLNVWGFFCCVCNCFQGCNQERNPLLLYNQFAFLSLLSYLNLPGVVWPSGGSGKLRYIVSPEDNNIQ